MVGTQSPKSNVLLVEATKPPKLPVTALVTAPKPTEGEVQRRVLPEPVQVPAAPEEAAAVEVESLAEDVATAAAEVACLLLGTVFIFTIWRIDLQLG